MDNNTFTQHLQGLTAEELQTLIQNLGTSVDPSPVEVMGLVVQERIRRHALVCEEHACGFNPVAF